jgi:uncharacterized protein (TIGR03086 family)
VADFLGANEQLDDLAQPTVLPIGTVPAEIALRIAAGDLLVHAWDLAQATGQPFEPPADFVAAADGFYRLAITDDMREGGFFGAEVEVADDAAAMDKLLAFAGRQP